MSVDSISWLLPAQKTVQQTLWALSQIRDQTKRLGAEVILIDRPSAIGICRNLPSDVLLVRTEWPLSLPRLFEAGLAAAKGDFIVWCPWPDRIPSGHFRETIDFVARHDVVRLAAGKTGGSAAAALLKWLRLRLCHEAFVARRVTAQRIARRLSVWGDFPVTTSAILAMMRVTLCLPRGLPESTRLQTQADVDTDEPRRASRARRPTVRHPQTGRPLVSVVITAHNEGQEVLSTIESVEASTSAPIEFIVIDDGSTDGCCENLGRARLRVIRHESRVGVAFSRNAGAGVARGDVLLFLDGHQRVSVGCLDRCAAVALAEQAIVWPDVRTLHDRSNVGHGAFFRLGKNANPFTATWNNRRFRHSITKVTALRAPGYFVPRNLFSELRWISHLRGWGGSEAAMALKAFFLGIDILHVCGPQARHLFRPKFQYSVTDAEVCRNHALIARVCFDDRTWFEHWLPRVFESSLSPEAIRELDSPDVVAEHAEFLKLKRRSDREFWRGLLRRKEPANLSETRCVETASFAATTDES